MKKAAILSVDFGLSKVHCTVIMIDTGALSTECEKEYVWDLYSNKAAEIDPDKIWNAAQDVVEGVLKNTDPAEIELKGMVFSCFGESIIPIGSDRNPAYPMIGASDTRAEVEAAFIADKVPDYSEITGGNVASASVSSKILWLRNNRPEAFEKSAYFWSLQEFILSRLGLDACNDYTLAARKMMFDVRKGCWSEAICRCVGIRSEQLGPVVESYTAIGSVSAFGRVPLPGTLKVIIGAHDACCSAVGLGMTPANKDFLIGNNSGTWNLVNLYVDHFINSAEKAPLLTPGHGPVRGSYYFQIAGVVGPLMDWFVATFCAGKSLSEISKAAVYDASCNVRLISDPMTGDGCFKGLSYTNSIVDIYTGLIESITFPMRDVLNQYESLVDRKFSAMRISAGGAKADNWIQLKANILNLNMERVANLQASSVGATINACIGLGEYKNYDEAISSLVRVAKVFEPQSDMVRLYAERAEEFKAVMQKGPCFTIS